MTARRSRRRWKHVGVYMLPFLFCCTQGLLLNIHLPLKTGSSKNSTHYLDDLCLENEALASNLALRQTSSNANHGSVTEQIDFFSTHAPHITLYLVDFDVEDENGTIVESKLDMILDSVQQALVAPRDACRVDWPLVPTVKEGYAMFLLPDLACLQLLSDLVVNATKKFIHRPPVIPDWIHSLPAPERKKAFERIEKYGSPNVFEGFQPHITVGYDAMTPKRLRLAILKDLYTPQPCPANLTTVAVSKTGISGTVLQDGEFFRMLLVNETNTSLLQENPLAELKT